MLKIFLSWLIPFVCGTVLSSIVAYIVSKKKRLTSLEVGVQCLLRAEIIRDHKEYMQKGAIPLYAKEALVKEYNAYHSLGGNDVATGLYQDMMQLPVLQNTNMC